MWCAIIISIRKLLDKDSTMFIFLDLARGNFPAALGVIDKNLVILYYLIPIPQALLCILEEIKNGQDLPET